MTGSTPRSCRSLASFCVNVTFWLFEACYNGFLAASGGRQEAPRLPSLLHGDLTVGCPNSNSIGRALHGELSRSASTASFQNAFLRCPEGRFAGRLGSCGPLTHRKPALASDVGSTSRRVTAVRAWPGATPARALLGSPDDGAVCRGHVRAIILCKARRFWILGYESRLSVLMFLLPFFLLLLYYSTALLFVF